MPQLARGNVNVQRSVLPEEPESAVDVTVAKMMELALGQYGSRSPKIRALAINITRAAGVREKDYYNEIIAIHEWVKKNIRYVKDPVNQETLSYPEELAFNTRAGDCDDMTTLEIALLGALGHKAWPVTIGMTPGMFSHVYLQAQIPAGKHKMAGKIIDLDPIMKDWPAGRAAPAHRVKEMKIYRDMQRPERRSSSMSGLHDDLGDPYNMLPGMGEYVTSPSYLDDEHSHAQELLKPDIAKSGAVANSPKVSASMEGVDGMFGGIGQDATVVEEVGVPVPMENSNDLYQLGPKGPMTARRARLDTDAMPRTKVRDISAKTYEVPTISKALANSRGKKGTTVVESRKKIVIVKDDDAAKAASYAKTADEEGKELDGLHGTISEIQSSFMPGLGAIGNEDAEEISTKAGITGWWARRKAQAAACRAAWADEQARQLRMAKHKEAAKVADSIAKKERENVAKAENAALRAGQITHQMKRQDPLLAENIAMAEQALNSQVKDADAIDSDLGLDVNEMVNRSNRKAVRGRFGTQQYVESGNNTITPQQRLAIQSARSPKIVKDKMARFCALCARYRAQHGRRFSAAHRKSLRHTIAAPIPVIGVDDPSQRGRKYMTRPVSAESDQKLLTPGPVPAQVSGMGGLPQISSNKFINGAIYLYAGMKLGEILIKNHKRKK